METRARYDELDGYRGLAALAVVVFHAHVFGRVADAGPRGLLGVEAYPVLNALDGAVAGFFVLSGFVIFLPLARALLAGGATPSVGGFLARRARRLLPLYYAALGAVAFATWHGTPADRADLLTHATFLHVFSPDYVIQLIGPAWSLACEVIYYAVVALALPPLALLCRRLPSRRARATALLGLLAATIAASVGYKAVAFSSGALIFNSPVYLGPLARGDAFALGAALAVLVAARDGQPLLRGVAPSALRMAGGAAVALAILSRGTDLGYTYFHSLCGLAAALLVASTALAARGGRWERLLACRPLAGLGAVSYGIYLLHNPIREALVGTPLILGGPAHVARDTLVLLAVSVAVATATYRAIERPALLLGRRHGTSHGPATPAQLSAGMRDGVPSS